MRDRLPLTLFTTILLLGFSCPGVTHEFWVAPDKYRVETGEEVRGSLRVGQMMRGNEFPYLSHKFQSFQVHGPDGMRPIQGSEGDSPALRYTAGQAGLNIISYHSTAGEVQFDDWDNFTRYLEHEGLQGVAAAHEARGLPRAGFKEAYKRYAKSLVQVGAVRESDGDSAAGVPLELVALDNPYRDGLESLGVLLLRHGKPVSDHQIAVFYDDGAVSHSVVMTDANGEAEITVGGGGKFLLNATDLQPVDRGDVVWESYWASLTFGTPVDLSGLHPLDPLTNIEITRAVRIIAGSANANSETRISMITLAEPDKAHMLAWKPGDTFGRKAFAVVRNGAEVFEADIDLVAGNLLRWERIPGVQPAIQSSEWAMAEKLTKEDPRWIAAMNTRGYQDFAGIFCESLSAGFFDIPEERGKRLLKMPCYDRSGSDIHIYGRPIEGLISVVDLNRREVVRIIDTGAVPMSEANHDFGDNPASPDAPDSAETQAGSRFTLEGRMLSWRAWRFHIGFDQRFGPLLSLVTHRDGGQQRSVLYEGHLSEIFVPYMDPGQGWYYRAYMDAGEYGLGILASPLSAGIDCPRGAAYFNASFASPLGAPYVRERVMCVFERTTTEPLWRHWEALNGNYAGRVASELVVRAIPSIANYDYIVDWVFTEKGEIQVNIGATGIDAVKGVATKSMTDPGAEKDTASGMLVAPNLVAVHHDHYFSIRLDLDVDGPVNSFVREKLVADTMPDDHPRRSLWRLQPLPMEAEGALSMRKGPELWRIENAGQKSVLGHRPAYQLHGTSNATSLLSAKDWPQRRAEFSGETLWVTGRRQGERAAAGPYPNQGAGGTGLSSYVDGESSQQNDIVAWYTMGFHHLTRPEDWPVLPAVWHQLKLRPYGFFRKNPDVQ